MTAPTRRLRADAERSVAAILEAAERILGEDPTATMEQIAEAAGVARTTIHRRFASRDALIEAMTLAAWTEIRQVVEAARPHTAPVQVALHQATANVLQVKSRWRVALHPLNPPTPQTRLVQDAVIADCDAAFQRARDEGLIRPEVDLVWARQAYFALIGEACQIDSPGADPDQLAAQVVDTLLHGVG